MAKRKTKLPADKEAAYKQLALDLARNSIVTQCLARYLEQVIAAIYEDNIEPLKRAAFKWLDIDAVAPPETGFFLAWSPLHPDCPSVWKAELFHAARLANTPRHLSAAHFTKWAVIPLPETTQQ